MITNGTKVKVVDNSGAVLGRCIRILYPKSSKGRRFGYTGSIIIITVLQTITGSKIKKGDLFKALVVQTKKEEKMVKIVSNKKEEIEKGIVRGRKTNMSGCRRKYDENSVVLVKISPKNIEDWTPIGSRIKKGRVSELIERNKKCSKIMSIC